MSKLLSAVQIPNTDFAGEAYRNLVVSIGNADGPNQTKMFRGRHAPATLILCVTIQRGI